MSQLQERDSERYCLWASSQRVRVKVDLAKQEQLREQARAEIDLQNGRALFAAIAAATAAKLAIVGSIVASNFGFTLPAWPSSLPDSSPRRR